MRRRTKRQHAKRQPPLLRKNIDTIEIVCYNAENYERIKEFLIPVDN